MEDAKRKDLVRLFQTDTNFKIQNEDGKWPVIPEQYRIYQPITAYQPQPPSFSEKILEKMTSSKKPCECPPDCQCKRGLEDIGSFSLELQTWMSSCKNRFNKIECQCEDPLCKNAPSWRQQQKRLGQDLEETICWGIDLYTRKNIYLLLPENFSEEDKFEFI